jgi:hypothetical protein
MRIIKDDDVRVFTDQSGDTLTLLATVRQRDAEKASAMESKEAFQSLADMGLSMDDAMKQAGQFAEVPGRSPLPPIGRRSGHVCGRAEHRRRRGPRGLRLHGRRIGRLGRCSGRYRLGRGNPR